MLGALTIAKTVFLFLLKGFLDVNLKLQFTKPMETKVSPFQVRWAEALGKSECPYMFRWVFIFFGFSIRVHKWIRSDDKRFMHDHPWSFVTFVLKGEYTDVSPSLDVFCEPQEPIRETLKAGSFKYRASHHRHYVDVPKGGAWTLVITGRPKRKWGFWIDGNRLFRPLRFFNKYGHPPCSDQ